MNTPRYIAMWSGPRNISTAMMRSWENRSDTIVHDEPFYAHYLTNTSYDHPGEQEVIETYETDWRKVVDQLTAPLPAGKTVYYQKHMTHHMLPHIELDWMLSLTNCFLIREPARMLVSFSKVIAEPELAQTGLPQQVRLFDFIREQTGEIPPVISARDVLENPRHALQALCNAIDVPFDDAMLSWPPGRRETDGIWAKHWYASVERSTGFLPYHENHPQVPPHLTHLLDECELLYQQLEPYRLLRNG